MDGTEVGGMWGEVGESFHLYYRGSTEIDRHYSKPMLPWIISEIKNQQKSVEVTVEITLGNVVVRDTSSGVVILTHTVKQIHKCVMEQADHTCFLYTLRAADKEQPNVHGVTGYMAATDPDTLVPANISADQNYQCILLQAASEDQVRKYFACLRQQPREAITHIQDNMAFDAVNSIPDLSVHNESQFFEVLYVGRVKVSHSKVPSTFIDEALGAFKLRERTRQRQNSGGDQTNRSSISSAAASYQQDGSSMSVPNITLNTLSVLNTPSDPEMEFRSRSNSRDLGKTNLLDMFKSDQDNQEALKGNKVRFSLFQDEPYPQEVTNKNLTQEIFSSRMRSDSISEEDARDSKDSESVKGNDDDDNDDDLQPLNEPFRQRLRTISGDTSQFARRNSQTQEFPMRARAGSIGSLSARNRGYRPYENLSQEFNRTMLFHIGRNEIQLINPEFKNVQLNKHFKDIAHCIQGIKQNDHFGFICRELSGETTCYLGYVFKCQTSAVSDEMMQALSKAFAAVHEAQIKDRQSTLLCDQCPMKWFSQLCGDIEGLAAAKAHMNIMKHLNSLPEDDRTLLIAKYEGAEATDVQAQNNILMMLLRAHFECKQITHTHTALPGGSVRPDFPNSNKLETSLRNVKKSLATSFNQLLKREGRDSESAEKEILQEQQQEQLVSSLPSTPPSPISIPEKPYINPMPSHSKAHMEGLSDSPLRGGGGHRPRSSTVSSAGGDSMRKEFLAKRAAAKQKAAEQKAAEQKAVEQQNAGVTPKRSIFLKVGSPSAREEDNVFEGTNRNTSFRHAILQRVISPLKTNTGESFGQIGAKSNSESPQKKRSPAQLKILWKKAVFQNILLIRMEKENQRLRELQAEAALQRVCLNYEEEEIQLEAMQAWELMLSRPHARIDSNILHSGVRQGVPKSLRGEVWQLLMVQHCSRNPKSLPQITTFNLPYEELVKELASQQHAILIDLGRTFPSHPYFMQTLGPGQLSLFNVLKAYSLLDKDVGYCQGLGFVGAVLLLHVEEEGAYHLLKHLMFVMNIRRQYRPDPIGLQIQMYQLSRLLHDRLKSLYDHLENHEVIPQLFAAPWFLTLFASQFPLSFVVRVFDLLLLEGMEAVFKVALFLLKDNQDSLMGCDSFEQIMDYMKNSLPNLHLEQYTAVINQACECSLIRELQSYEVEYHVLQEELALSPQNDSDIKKLKEANKNLKRQNLDLLEQLHQSNSQQHALETSNQSLQQSQHHLEVRVRWLELERNNLKQLVTILSQHASKDVLAQVPANYQRFLPATPSIPAKEENKEAVIQKPLYMHGEDNFSQKSFFMHKEDPIVVKPSFSMKEEPPVIRKPSFKLTREEPPLILKPSIRLTLDEPISPKSFSSFLHKEPSVQKPPSFSLHKDDKVAEHKEKENDKPNEMEIEMKTIENPSTLEVPTQPSGLRTVSMDYSLMQRYIKNLVP